MIQNLQVVADILALVATGHPVSLAWQTTSPARAFLQAFDSHQQHKRIERAELAIADLQCIVAQHQLVIPDTLESEEDVDLFEEILNKAMEEVDESKRRHHSWYILWYLDSKAPADLVRRFGRAISELDANEMSLLSQLAHRKDPSFELDDITLIDRLAYLGLMQGYGQGKNAGQPTNAGRVFVTWIVDPAITNKKPTED
ncbi:MAG: hypothetical protein KDA20_07045 [Phycisphaerales bacterium]|nr:hypothetical protein [Phycisphaerales bacterium]